MGVRAGGHHLLVVDDDCAIRALFAINLVKSGFSVTTAASGREGLDMASRLLPHLVLADIIMPDLSGPTLVHRLRASPATRGIPCILMTGKQFVDVATEDAFNRTVRSIRKDLPHAALVRLIQSEIAHSSSIQSSSVARFAPPQLTYNVAAKSVSSPKKTVVLAERLFRLFVILARNTGLSRAELSRRMFNAEEHVKTIDEYLHCLHRALDELAEGLVLHEHCYRFVPQPIEDPTFSVEEQAQPPRSLLSVRSRNLS